MEENPASVSSFFHTLTAQKKIVLVGAILLIGISYIALNIGIWKFAKNSQKAAQTVAEKKSASSEAQQIGSSSNEGSTPPPTQGPTPTPTPRQTGPGPWACDPLGICNHYQDAKGIGCPKTYADDHCLDECGDTKVQCPK